MPAKKKIAVPAAKAPKKTETTKKDYLALVQAALTKKLPTAHVGRAGDGKALTEIRTVVPSGLDVLDQYVIGRGGLLCGRIMEIFGDESSGKTALALAFIAAFQRMFPDGLQFLCDSEHSYETPRAQSFDVDTDRLLLVQPLSHDESRDAILTFLENLPDDGPPSVLVWDSVAGNAPESETTALAKDKDPRIGMASQINSQICRRAVVLAPRKNAHIIFVNQVRTKIGVVFGDPTTTPGGRAIPFFSALRLQLWGGKAIKVGDTAIGRLVTVKAFKNKVAPPWRKAKLRLDFGLGWDNGWSTLHRAKELKIIDAKAKGPEAVAEAKKLLDACKWGAGLDLPPQVETVNEDAYVAPDDESEDIAEAAV